MKYNKALPIAVILGILGLSGCSIKMMDLNALKQNIKVQPSPLELHGDSVIATISADLPGNMLKGGVKYVFEVAYKPANAEEKIFNGSPKEYMHKSGQSSTQKVNITNKYSLAYEERMERGVVKLRGKAIKGSKEVKSPQDLELAQGVITTSRLVQPTYYENFIASGFVFRDEYEPYTMDFFFLKGKSDLRTTEVKGGEGKRFDEYIKGQYPTYTATFTGSHSPEGATKINEKLSNERAGIVQDHYKKTAAHYKYEANNVSYVNKAVIENWVGFKALLKDVKELSDEKKNEIIAIVDGPGDFVSKELKLQTLSSYRVIESKLYPKLRNSKVEILKIKDKKTEAEIVATAAKIGRGEEDVNALQDIELAFAAEKTPALEEKEKIYAAIIKRSGSYAAQNNLGAVYLAMAKKSTNENERTELLDKAILNFETSLKKQESAEAYANLAGAKLMKKDFNAATTAMNKVSGSGTSGSVATSVNAFKGYTAILRGDYDNAIQVLSSAGNDPVVLYNKGLSYLLKASKAAGETGTADYSKAESAFKEATDASDKNAYAFYGAAITAARMKKDEAVFSNLAKAIQLNTKLKDRVVTDLEFSNYFKNQKFLDVLK